MVGVRTPVLTLFALALLSCAEARRAGEHQADSIRQRAAAPIQEQAPRGAAAPAPDAGFFDPDGFYFPMPSLAYGGYEFRWFELATLEYYYGGALHYDRPRFLPPHAQLILAPLGADSTAAPMCPAPLITRDTVDVRCPATPIGSVRIAGHFVDQRGQYWNRGDVQPQQTVIIVARVTVEADGRLVLSRQVSFTYWQGD